MGHAAFYGLAVISDSWIMYALALFSQCATFAFIHYVERYACAPRPFVSRCGRSTDASGIVPASPPRAAPRQAPYAQGVRR